ncbi:MAG: hypothetical protein H6706_11935 [Myxococcales bacterium]|nr:hypothetical protein [Myxococcales bacterium]
MHRRTCTDTLSRLYVDHSDRLCASLRRKFRAVPPDLVADRVQDAFVMLLRRPALPDDPERLLCTIAWRLVRAEVRHQRVRVRAAQLPSPAPVGPGHRLEARHRLRQVQALVPAAAARFGGRQPQQLRVALGIRLGGATDTHAAEAAGVRREAVNRSVRWMAGRLDGGPAYSGSMVS